MARTPLNTQLILKEVLGLFTNELVAAGKCTRKYEKQFAKTGAKIGDKVSVRLPSLHEVANGEVMSTAQDLTDRSITIEVNKRKHIPLSWGQQDLTLNIDDFSERYLKDPVRKMANQVDYDVLDAMYKGAYNFVGVPGTNPSTAATFLSAGTLMDNEGVSRGSRNLILSSAMQATAVDAFKGFFNPQSQIGEQVKKGMIGKNFLGLDTWNMDQNVRRHTLGTLTGSTPLANSATAQTGNSIVTDGWANSTLVLKKGDKVGFAGVRQINRMSYDAYDQLKLFTVTADVTSDGSGNATIPIEGGEGGAGLIATGAARNASAAIADNAAVYVWGKAAANFADITGKTMDAGVVCTPESTALVMVDLQPLEAGAVSTRISDPDLGISMLWTRQSDIRTMQTIGRLDILYGIKVVRPEGVLVMAG